MRDTTHVPPRVAAAPGRRLAAALLLLAAAPAALQAQGDDRAAAQALARRVDAVRTGVVHFSYEAREGVCGDGSNVRVRDGGRTVRWNDARYREWESDCEPGPVRISLTRRDGALVALRSYVGGRWASESGLPVTDLGTVAPAAASAYLLGLAATAEGEPAAQAIFPATLARGAEPWPQLLRLARDAGRSERVRRDAVFWVSQAAGEAVTRELSALVDESDTSLPVREHAIFALSQRPADEAVPALIRVARTSPSPRLRQRAMFWLGQSKDARALAFFEEILAGR